MAVLKARDAKSLNKEGRESKLKELKMELVRANVSANKANAKTKEIKRAIARILTFNRAEETQGKLEKNT